MVPVAGKPILGHIFELLGRTGFEEANVNVCYLADAILGHYGEETLVHGMTVRFSRERRSPKLSVKARAIAKSHATAGLASLPTTAM
jgi:NDP-sugar pyrophosphorylase family protein